MTRAGVEEKPRPLDIPLDIVRAWSLKLSRFVSKYSSRLNGYFPAVAAVAFAFLFHLASAAVYGPGRTPIVTFVYVLAFLISAWCGYGPGVVATLVLGAAVASVSRRGLTLENINPTAVALFLLLSVVVSAQAASRRRVESLLKTINAELDARVKQQTMALAEANTTLQHRLAELETLYGKLSVGLCFLDRNLQFVRVNEKFASISGAPVQEHLGRELRDVLDQSLADVLERLCGRVLATEEPILDYEISVRPAGTVQVWAVSCSAVPSTNGVLGLQLAMQDITERKQAEEDLNEANSDLKRANEDLEQFAYSASHDLQEPIRTVAIYSQMLKRKFEDELGADGNDYIGYTLGGALRMEQLVKDLLAYTQASGGSGPPEVVNASDAVKQALSNLRAAITESGAQIVYQDLPEVRIRETHLVQLFQNIIGNAIKYRNSSPPHVIISASATEDGDWVFAVKDNGIGIDKKYQEQIFGIFKRLHVATEYPGTGMGLAICRRIVERHGGRIWVESNPQGGATFRFTLRAASEFKR